MWAFLDANENPFPPFPATTECEGYERYPEPQPLQLLDLLSNTYGIATEQILISRGADEAIDLLLRAFCAAGKDAILINTPAFAIYEMAAQIQNAAIHAVPLTRESFQLDVPLILEKCKNHPEIKLVFICSPNNPTSNLARREDILAIAKGVFGKALVVVDEAYVEFSGAPSLSAEIANHPNIVVLRTLSKEYSLAGERCGVTLAHTDVISLMGRILAPYPLTVSSVRAVAKGMSAEGRKKAQENIKLVLQWRDELIAALKKIPAVQHIYPTDTNFMVVKSPQPKLLVQMMEKEGIKIRDRSTVAGL